MTGPAVIAGAPAGLAMVAVLLPKRAFECPLSDF